MRRDFHGGVYARARCTANEQRDFPDAEVVIFLHFCGHVLHLLQAGRDQARQAHNVCALDLGARQYLVARHHHAHVDDFKVVALEHHRHDVFANVVHVALDRGDDDLAFGFNIATGGL